MRKIGNMSGLYRPSGVSSWFNVYFWLILRPFFLAGGGVKIPARFFIGCVLSSTFPDYNRLASPPSKLYLVAPGRNARIGVLVLVLFMIFIS